MLKTIEALTEQIRAYDRLIDELASRYPATEVLRQVTGVGALTAITYALTLGDPSRFGISRDIGRIWA
jgi:transposase